MEEVSWRVNRVKVLVIMVLPRYSFGEYQFEAQLVRTHYRGIGPSVEEALAKLWASPAGEIREKFEVYARKYPSRESS